MPEISVIVPIYKVEPYIHRCIDSILGQTFTNFDLILIDDGSPDHCGKICDEYANKDNRVHVVHQQNGGLSAARNAGIDWSFGNSDSKWLTFVDSDDWIHKKYLELLYNTAVKNDADICSCGHCKVFDFQDHSVTDQPMIFAGTAEQLFSEVNDYCFFNLDVAWSRLYKKECFATIRFPVGKFHEDAYISYKILFLCKRNAVVKETLYYYFQNANGIMCSAMSVKKLTDHLDAFEERTRFFYTNKSKLFFQKSFMFFCNLVEECYEKYRHDKTYLPALIQRKKTIKQFVRKYYDYLPTSVKKSGYRKATIIYQSKKRDFKSDFHITAKKKGGLYSILWAIKTVIKAKIIDIYYLLFGNILFLKQKRNKGK